MITKFQLFEVANTYNYTQYVSELTPEQRIKIINELGYEKYELMYALGRTQYGVLIVGDDKIVKLTTDEAEADNSNLLRKYNCKYIANYYDVREIYIDDKDTGIYAIVMDKLDTFNEEETQIYTKLMRYNENLGIDYGDVWEYPDSDKLDAYFVNSFRICADIKRFFLMYKDEPKKALLDTIFEGHNNIVRECKKLKIPADDLHYANVAWKNGKMVGFDLGVIATGRKNKTLKRISI